jgi:signal transduction histidine kinase
VSRTAVGELSMIRWILRDVSEQRRAADRLRAISASVEHRVAERTARLEQMVLERDARLAVLDAELAAEREQRLRAEARSARRADLLGILSHEIRTPLHASQGYVELLEMTGASLTPEQQGYLARMHRVQSYLLSILEGVLSLARLERGVADLYLADVGVEAVLATIPPLAQPQMLEKQLTFEHIAGDPSVTIYADREKVQQIVLNLLSNAVKFTPPGGAITVGWEAGVDAVAIRVADTGGGIRLADLERIFEPFVQAGAAPSPAPRGAGLGLAISRQLARLMGGDLTVVSAPGNGATFTLRLPRHAGGALLDSADDPANRERSGDA